MFLCGRGDKTPVISIPHFWLFPKPYENVSSKKV
jgi:hypothetical protein